jgi:hypothetical protein
MKSAILFALASLATSCTIMRPADFADGKPTFEPTKFFAGRTRSQGVLETRDGTPMQQVFTQTRGTWDGGELRIEQDLQFSGGKTSHRSWRLRKIDAHHYEATANDIVGTVRGEAYGNVFHWDFMLSPSPGNPFTRVRMSQWMYLQPDGKTMVNHTTFRKAGIVVAQVTEQFRR